jgi:hypothetical protein
LEEEKRKLQDMINGVLQNDTLDETAKAAMIQTLKSDAEKNQQILVEKAKLISHSQEATMLSLQQQQGLLTQLVERSKSAQHAWDRAWTPEQLANKRLDTARAMEVARDNFASSMLELSVENDALYTATERAASGQETAARMHFQQAVDTRSARNSKLIQGLDQLANSSLA